MESVVTHIDGVKERKGKERKGKRLRDEWDMYLTYKAEDNTLVP